MHGRQHSMKVRVAVRVSVMGSSGLGMWSLTPYVMAAALMVPSHYCGQLGLGMGWLFVSS